MFNPKKPRRVSFSNKNTIRLYKRREHSKSLSVVNDENKKDNFAILDFDSPVSSDYSTDNIDLKSFHNATKNLLSLNFDSPSTESEEIFNMSIDNDTPNQRKKIANKIPISWNYGNSTKLFFLPESLNDKEETKSSISNSENDLSLLDLIEADEKGDTIELENTGDFLLSNYDDDSFSNFNIMSPFSEDDISEEINISEHLTVQEFLSKVQVNFHVFDRTPRKISLGFPSDSITSLLSKNMDSDPSLSREQIQTKKYLLLQSLEYNKNFSNHLELEMNKINKNIQEIESDLSQNNPLLFKNIQTDISLRRTIKLWHKQTTKISKLKWYYALQNHLYKEYQKKLYEIQDILSIYIKEIEGSIIKSVKDVNNRLSPSKNILNSYKNPNDYKDLEFKLSEYIDKLDTMNGLIHWKLIKSQKYSERSSLTIRFAYCNYELSFQTNQSPIKNPKFTCLFYRNYPSPIHNNSIIDEKRDQVIQFIMSKNPLIQKSNCFSKLPFLLEDFTIVLTRLIDFLDFLSLYLKKNELKCSNFEYKSFNEHFLHVGNGKFNIQMVCKHVIKRKRIVLRFTCDYRSGIVNYSKGIPSTNSFLPNNSDSFLLHSPPDL